MWVELRGVLLGWYARLCRESDESDDDSVLDENTAHMCNIHAHLLITLRNASLGELDEARVRSVLCALLFMSTRHEWNEELLDQA